MSNNKGKNILDEMSPRTKSTGEMGEKTPPHKMKKSLKQIQQEVQIEENRENGEKLEKEIEKINVQYELQQRQIYDKIFKIYGKQLRHMEQVTLDFIHGKLTLDDYIDSFETAIFTHGMTIQLVEFIHDYTKKFLA